MFILASFNFGGPSEYAVVATLILAPIMGFFTGMLTQKASNRWLLGAGVGVGQCVMILAVNNTWKQGGALFLGIVLVFVAPICAILGGLSSALAGWVWYKLVNSLCGPPVVEADLVTDKHQTN